MLPQIPRVTGNHPLSDMETIHLLCEVEAYPRPTITWLVRNLATVRVVLSTSRISIYNTSDVYTDGGKPYSNSILVINDVNFKDSGDYLCIARANMHTAVQSDAHRVTVVCKTHQSSIQRE